MRRGLFYRATIAFYINICMAVLAAAFVSKSLLTSSRTVFRSYSRAPLPLAMQTVKGDGNGGEGIVLVPVNQKYSNVVVWMHGLGDTASGWSGAMPSFRVRDTKFILPTAPTRPITVNGGYPMPGWSDIYAIDENSREDATGFDQSALRVKALLDIEKAKGIPADRMIVGGFSQGGALAMHVALRYPEKLAGCVGCSAWVPLRDAYPDSLGAGVKEGIPFLQCHGNVDQVVNYSWGHHSHELLKRMGINSQFTTYPNMGHSACEEEFEAVGDFIRSVLPPPAST